MFFRFLRVISILSFVFMLSGCKKEDTDTSSASGETTGAATAGTNTGTTSTGASTGGTNTGATPKVIIKYSCMCNPDIVAEDDVPKRLRAKNSSTIEEAKLEITEACKDMKSGDQEVRLFACSERL